MSMIKEVDEKVDEESVTVCDGRGPMALHVKVDIPEPNGGHAP